MKTVYKLDLYHRNIAFFIDIESFINFYQPPVKSNVMNRIKNILVLIMECLKKATSTQERVQGTTASTSYSAS